MEQVPPSPLLVPFTLIPKAQPEPSESWQKLLSWNNIPNPILSLSSLSPFLWNCGKSKSEPVCPHLWIPKMRSPHSSLSGSGSLSPSGPAVRHCLSCCSVAYSKVRRHSSVSEHSLKSDTIIPQQRCCINHPSWVSLWRGNKRHINGKGNPVKHILLVKNMKIASIEIFLFFFLSWTTIRSFSRSTSGQEIQTFFFFPH